MRFAGFWKRSVAFGYDTIIVQLLALTAMFLFYHFPTLEQVTTLAPEVDSWWDGFKNAYLVIGFFYNVLMVAGPKQATLGKQYCGIQVVMADGSKPNLRQSAIRHVSCAISSAVGGIGFLTIAFTQEKLGIHDVIAGTRVVYKERTL